MTVQRRRRFLDTHFSPPEEYEKFLQSQPTKTTQNEKTIENSQTIHIHGLSFQHVLSQNEEQKIHLDNIHLKLKRGKPVAIVGASGCGKTTLMTVLRGLYTGGSGLCSVDGVDMSPHQLADHTFLFPQSPELFADTILFNICLGYSASSEEISTVVEISQFASVLERLPNGLQSNIAEKGVNLSGGERQRLALARSIFFALRQKSQVILLDEITSSVDTINEQEIFSKLLNLFSHHFVVASIHKLNLLSNFEYIYVLADGKVVQEGKENELKNSGQFLEMIKRFEGLEEDEKAIN